MRTRLAEACAVLQQTLLPYLTTCLCAKRGRGAVRSDVRVTAGCTALA